MKKICFLFSIFILSISASFALPHVTQNVPDFSGQYVYYRDYSFERESYIGILCYDESTYAFRYYAPAIIEKKNPQPEKNIHILFTIDSEKEDLELTGERIVTSVTPEDTDFVNYIHDFFYEMTKRRQNAGEVVSEKQEYQDYEQFGGMVTLYFNPLIPIFNLEKIVSVDKKTILQIITAGQLVASEDESFSNFTGIAEKFKDTTHKFKKNKKAKPENIEYKAGENSSVLKAKLDSSWNPAAENFFTLNNVAVFTVNEVTSPMEGKLDILKRRLLLGNELVYPNWQNQKIESKNGGTLFTQISYHAESNSYTYDFKFIRELDPKTVALYTLTVFAGAYTSDKKYFNAIIESFE
ncbi:hypothetical protein [uncultured Treponema sp.]|uniref:hypothetical protein n=1 Tax=uncultured Treponema sp. TaxID=162155 RepID=UPI0025F8C24A|nr:hypothetical protein [uncultured Treponema sp.]